MPGLLKCGLFRLALDYKFLEGRGPSCAIQLCKANTKKTVWYVVLLLSVCWSQEQWLTPLIPASQKAEIRKILVQDKSRKKVRETLTPSISRMCWHASVIPAAQEVIGRRFTI
jgi:hypothetical protein